MEAKTINRLPLGFYIVSIAAFLFGLARLVIQPIFTLYILELGASIVQVGLILSLQSFFMIVLRIPLTLFSQRIGEIRMLYLTFIVQATTQILYFLSPSPTWLYFIPLYQIIATGSFFQLATSISSNMAPPTRQGDALGRYMTFMSSAMFVGPVICGALVGHISYRQLFLVSALFPTVGLILFQRYATGMVNPCFVIESEGSIRGAVAFEALKTVLRERNLLLLSVIKTTYSISNNIFIALFSIYAVRQLGFTPSVAALLFSVMGLANTLVKFPAGKISDRLDRKTLLFITFGAIILVYASMALVKNLILIGVLVTIFGVCWGTRAVTEWTFIATTVSQEAKTVAISFQEIFWDMGASTGSILAGLFAEILPFSSIFLIAALINIPAIPSIYFMKRTRNSP